MSIDHYVTRLSRYAPLPNCFNPWRGRSAAALLRKRNLAAYFNRMAETGPTVLLVGEAPGYRGCALTGVPFTSERILVEGAAGLFGENQSFKILGDVQKPTSEASATIVWGALTALNKPLPLIWNAFPFHPHRPENKASNRPPNKQELDVGARFIQNLLKLFPSIKTVVAVGNRADESLTRQAIEHLKIRHPSHGGKKDFVAGLTAILD